MWFGIGIIVLERPAVSVIRIKHSAEIGEMVWIWTRVSSHRLPLFVPVFSFSLYSYILNTEAAGTLRMLV
jgi:hypothetical protein